MILIHECSMKTYRINFLSFIFQFIVLLKTHWIQSSGKTVNTELQEEVGKGPNEVSFGELKS